MVDDRIVHVAGVFNWMVGEAGVLEKEQWLGSRVYMPGS